MLATPLIDDDLEYAAHSLSRLEPLAMLVPSYAVFEDQVSFLAERSRGCICLQVYMSLMNVTNECWVGRRCDHSEDVRPDVVFLFLFLQLMELDPRAPHADD